jgi:hypothetical protein
MAIQPQVLSMTVATNLILVVYLVEGNAWMRLKRG